MMPTPPGLTYYPDSRPGITRQRRGRGFSYLAPDGTRIDSAAERKRIQALAVPPAYENVWICPKRNGHLQATGRDDRQRKQYRYHPDWTSFRAQKKYDSLAEFGEHLPAIRRRVARDLNGEAGEHRFAIAAVIAMIDHLSIRVGHPEYAAENGTYGATTLTSGHLRLRNGDLELRYTAKGNKDVRRTVGNRKLLQTLQKLEDLPGMELIKWLDDDGTPRAVSSGEVNRWLAEVTESDVHTAKSFRTWNGSVAALGEARRLIAAGEPVTIKALSECAAERLANTPTIARNSYIHPRVIALAEEGGAPIETPEERSGLRADERRLLELLAR